MTKGIVFIIGLTLAGCSEAKDQRCEQLVEYGCVSVMKEAYEAGCAQGISVPESAWKTCDEIHSRFPHPLQIFPSHQQTNGSGESL